MTAKNSHEKKNEAAKLKKVQDQVKSIIEVKKSFRNLETKYMIFCNNKIIEFFQQKQIFFSRYLCNLMVMLTFDISNQIFSLKI